MYGKGDNGTMEKIELFCDICVKPLTTISPCIDATGETVELCHHNVYKTLKYDTTKIFPHLCKRCASKLDYLFENIELKEKENTELLKKMHKLNLMRRKMFNTNG